MSIQTTTGLTSGKIDEKVFNIDAFSKTTSSEETSSSKTFSQHLQDKIMDINSQSKTADQKAIEVSTGKNEALHETMLELTKAELSFNLLVQVRNRALEAYQEVMRMQV